MSLGFSMMQASMAYYECDKNQERAGNLLFDRLANGEIDNDSFNIEGALWEDEEDEEGQ